MHGQNWPLRKKMITLVVLGYTTFVVTWGSSIFSTATLSVSAYFGVSIEVALLGISLYVLGFAFGPLICMIVPQLPILKQELSGIGGPLSELYGRRNPLIISIFGFAIFQIAVAVGKDIQTVLICRFFGGVFASSPLAVVGAVLADMFGPETRGQAVAVFSMMVFGGPLFGPIAGSFITASYLGWRWTEYITAIMGFLALALIVLFLEETYPPIILVQKAEHLRRITKKFANPSY